MAPLDETQKNPPGRKNDDQIGEETAPSRAEREPGRDSNVERESLASRPSQKYPWDGHVPDPDSTRPSSDEIGPEEDVEK